MITVQTAGLNTAVSTLANLSPDLQKKAKRAVKKTLTQAKKDAVDQVLERFTIQKPRITRTLRIKVSDLQGDLISSGKANPLSKFNTSPKGRIRLRGKYITAEVIRGQSRIIRTIWRKSKGESIFERLGKSRLPYKIKRSYTTPEMLNYSSVTEKVLEFMQRRFEENFSL